MRHRENFYGVRTSVGHAGPRLLDHVAPDQVAAVVRRTIQRVFKHDDGIPFEQLVADLGFTMEQIQNHRLDDERDTAA